MPTAPPDLTKKLIFAWFAYSLDPDAEHPLGPSDPHIVCRKCWRPKPLEEFHKARNANGRSHCCKACHRELYEKPQREKRKAVAAEKRAQRRRFCPSCGKAQPLAGWGRCPRGHLRKICPDCTAAREARCVAAQAAGYQDWSHTPQHRRLVRERAARREGRTLPEYVPQAERERRAREHFLCRRTEREADRIRAHYFGSLVQAYNRIAHATPEVAATIREAHAAEQREWYAHHRQQEVARHLIWKAANPARVSEYGQTRLERESDGADGTVTREAILQLKRDATECVYCGSRLILKQTDHMIPLGLGGEHSLRNIVIVCSDCNARKATLSYEKWIERIEPRHRARIMAIYLERYGRTAA